MPAAPNSEPQVHIAGMLVQARPADLPRVMQALAALPAIEVHLSDPSGKLVVVGECAGEEETLALIGHIRDLPGVLNVALVYQHAESALAMEEEISDETDAPGVH